VNSTLRSIDTDSLGIVSMIRERYETIGQDVGPVGNIYMVFMHDLVVHFTGILMHRVAREYYSDSVQFPWIDKKYALAPFLVDSIGNGYAGRHYSLYSRLRRLPLSRAALGEALPFGYQQDRMVAKLVNLLGSYKPFVQAYLPNRHDQIWDLLDCVSELCRLHGIPNSETVRHNWRRYVDIHSTQQQSVIKERGLLLGTRNSLQNRKLAVNYLQQDKEVVAVSHGEVANSVMDEPPFGYSERTLCTTLVDYGDFDSDGEYNVPLIPPRRLIKRDAPVVRSIHQANSEIRLSTRQFSRALYIPTTYSGNGLYGPFHIYEDAVYSRWQQALFESLPTLTMKVHPKSRSQPPANVSLEIRQLENCIQDYELFVFDYFATGSMLALMTPKPVIYFDIGLRRLHRMFEQDIKSRCEYAKIDLCGDLSNQVIGALDRFLLEEKTRNNNVIAQYALCQESRFNWLNLLKSVARGVSPS